MAAHRIGRGDLREAIVDMLRRTRGVLAVWEAGSRARGRVDRYSDLDIGVLVTGGVQRRVWRRIEERFRRLGGIAVAWHEPDPVFAGIDKKTYRLARTSRWLQIDVGLFAEGVELHQEPERHGEVEVLWDPRGRLRPPAWDTQAQRRKLRIALHHLVMRFALYREFFRKELARGRTVDAFRMYSSFVVQPMVAILGMVHRPARWDFGLRYVHDEMPAAAAALIERLSYVPGPEALEARYREVVREFRRARVVLARRGITPLDEAGEDVAPAR